jgi:hypothetical protein
MMEAMVCFASERECSGEEEEEVVVVVVVVVVVCECNV